MKKITLLIVCLLTIVSCDSSEKSEIDRKIAETEGRILWESDVEGIFSPNLTKEDSLYLLNTFINNWVRKQLLGAVAERQLSTEQKDVAQELEDYRLSLLIYRYEKVYIEQRLNTDISEEEIEKFYHDYSDNFVAVNPLVKAMYIKIKKDSQELKHILQIYRLREPEKMVELASLCEGVAERFTDFNEEWVEFNRLSRDLPEGNYNAALTQRYIETNDDRYDYLLHLYEIIMPGSNTPLEYEQENIRSIILNKRRQELIKSLENSIYNEAMNHDKVKIYVDKE